MGQAQASKPLRNNLALCALPLAACGRPSSPPLTGPDFTVSVPSGSIGDRVWNDANANRAQDAGEKGLAVWTVTISGADPHGRGLRISEVGGTGAPGHWGTGAPADG